MLRILTILILLTGAAFAQQDTLPDLTSDQTLPVLNESLRRTGASVRQLSSAFGGTSILPISGGGTNASTVLDAQKNLIGIGTTGAFVISDGSGLVFYNPGTSGLFLKTNGLGQAPEWASLATYSSGDTIIGGPTLMAAHSEAAYTKIGEVKVLGSGTVKTRFVLNSDNGSPNTVYGRIYKNGEAVGTERSIVSGGLSSCSEYSEDISGITSGDLIQLYTYNTVHSQHRSGGLIVSVSGAEGSTAVKPVIYLGDNSNLVVRCLAVGTIGTLGDLAATQAGDLYVKSAASTWTAK